MIWNVFRRTPENPIEKGEEVYPRSLEVLRAWRRWPPHSKNDKTNQFGGEKRMKKHYVILASLLVMAFIVGACATATPEPTPVPAVEPTEEPMEEHDDEHEEPMADVTPVTVCLVTDLAGVDDRSFNASGWQGVNDAVAAGFANVDPILLESDAAEDYQPNIDGCLAQGAEHIVTVGFALGEATATNAAANPDVLWTIVDVGGLGLDNVRELIYQTDEAAFAAGYLAAGVSKTGIIGTYGGANFPTVSIFMDGLTRGVAYYNEQKGTDVQVIGWDVDAADGQFTGSFTDMGLARTTCEGILDEGADIMLPVGGAINLPCGDAIIARGLDASLIGVDADAFFAMPETYEDLWLVTIEKGIAVQVMRSIEAHASGTWTPGGALGTVANGAVGLSDYHSWGGEIPPELKAEVEAILQAIEDGDLDAAFTPVG
jgi:basic membrane protein A